MKESTKTTFWVLGTLAVIGGGAALLAVEANKTQAGSPGGGSPPPTPPSTSNSGGTTLPPAASTNDGSTPSNGGVTATFPITTGPQETDITGDGTIGVTAPQGGNNMVFYGPQGSSCRTEGLLGCVNVMKGDLKVIAWGWNKHKAAWYCTVSGTQGQLLILWQDGSQGHHSTTINVSAPLVFAPGTFTFSPGVHV